MTKGFNLATTPTILHSNDYKSWSEVRLIIHNTSTANRQVTINVRNTVTSTTYQIFNDNIPANKTIELLPIVLDPNWEIEAYANGTGIVVLVHGSEWYNLL